MRFIFVRHPQTIANEIGYIYGKTDYPYTELGQKQCALAIEAATGFQCDQLVSSPLGRARHLAEGIAKNKDMMMILDEALEEMHYGILEGLTVDEGQVKYPEVMERFLKGDDDFTIPEGEDVEHFFFRVHSFLEQCLEKNEDVLIVSHGGVIRTAIEYLLDAEEGFSWSLEIGNGSIIEIVCEDGYHRLLNMINQPE
mgnify:CR=1 FL=1